MTINTQISAIQKMIRFTVETQLLQCSAVNSMTNSSDGGVPGANHHRKGPP